jgi:fluoroquinolone transport system ATP-binding protein
MKNRLSIARALLHNPSLLFLDEPTAGLDPVNARMVKNLIRQQQADGKTVFLTTHDMTAADQLCDRLAFIVDGQICQVGQPRELKIRHGQAVVRIEYLSNGHMQDQEFPLQALAQNAAFQQLLGQAEIQTIHTLEATLEDVFIAATGRSLI